MKEVDGRPRGAWYEFAKVVWAVPQGRAVFAVTARHSCDFAVDDGFGGERLERWIQVTCNADDFEGRPAFAFCRFLVDRGPRSFDLALLCKNIAASGLRGYRRGPAELFLAWETNGRAQLVPPGTWLDRAHFKGTYEAHIGWEDLTSAYRQELALVEMTHQGPDEFRAAEADYVVATMRLVNFREGVDPNAAG